MKKDNIRDGKTMEKLKMHSPDLTRQNIDRIRELFPNCVTEVKGEDGTVKPAVDFDLLRQELSDSIVEGPRERYQLDWPGKREALLTANAPIAKTLRPSRGESVDFDSTENLYIEGDNLDAMKLLQETYLGKVKMIYIDPPYNTGNEFIYNDKFSISIKENRERSGTVNSEGHVLVDEEKWKLNSTSNGRFHSDWNSMILSRLKLARALLKEDGVIFMSVDDGEVHNLRKVADEIFGECNFVANIIWEKKFAPQNDAKWLSDNHDHILLYAKNKVIWRPYKLPRTEENNSRFSNPDNDYRGPWASSDMTVRTYTPNNDYPITTPNGNVISPTNGRCWAVSREKFELLIQDNRVWFGKSGENVPRYKTFLSEVEDGIVPLTIWKFGDVGHNQEARQETKLLFNDNAYFDSPKPTRLLARALTISTKNEDLILDFFSGSATTAHAVMKLNAEDGGKRKFIMVQLPEECDEKSEAFKAGYKTIAEIGKERIRRAGKKIKEENATNAPDLDIGFRVLKVDSSNMNDIHYAPDEIKADDLIQSIENIKPDRTPEDLLFQVLLDWGIDLTYPIERREVIGKTVFFVADNALAACFDRGISEELVKELAKSEPLRMVFRDTGFESDQVKINVTQILKQLSPETDVRAI